MKDAINFIEPDLIAYSISWFDELTAAAAKLTDATYTLDADSTTYTIKYATGLTETISTGTKLENDKLVADAAKLKEWAQLKAEFVKVIDEVIKDAQTAADDALKLAQEQVDTQK